MNDSHLSLLFYYGPYLIIFVILILVIKFDISTIEKRKKLIKTVIIDISVALMICIVLSPYIQKFNPYSKQDIEKVILVEEAISNLINETKNNNLSNLYDSSGKLPLNIKVNDPNSLKNLISSMQDVIYYNGNLYGPYLPRKKYKISGIYGAYTPHGYSFKLNIKNVGYKVHIKMDSKYKPHVSVLFVDNYLDSTIKID